MTEKLTVSDSSLKLHAVEILTFSQQINKFTVLLERTGSYYGVHFAQTPAICNLFNGAVSKHDHRGQMSESFLLSFLFFPPWSRVISEKLTGLQLVTKYPTVYQSRRFITAFTRASHLTPS
jgi:hypothetical protein